MSNQIKYRFYPRIWEEGFTGTLKIKNTGDLVETWQVEFVSEFAINQHDGEYEILGAEVISEEQLVDGGYRYIIKPLAYNTILDPKESVFITFNSTWLEEELPEISNIIFNIPEEPVETPVEPPVEPPSESELDFNIQINPWSQNSGATVLLDVINVGDDEIPEVEIKFNSDFQIRDLPTDVWGAEIVSETAVDGGYEYILNLAGNQDLDPGEQHSFGFNTEDHTPEFKYIGLNDSSEPPVERPVEPPVELPVEPPSESELDFDIQINPWSQNSGATVLLDVINVGEDEIPEVEIKFNSDFQIRGLPTDVWGAEIVSETAVDGGYEYILNLAGNQDLDPGESHSFGFNTEDYTPEFKYIGLNDGSTPITPPTPTPTPTPTPSPTPISDNAIFVGFEKHSDNTKYNRSAQSRDWDVAWSNENMDKFTTITDDISHSGDKSLKVTYPSYEQGSKAAAWQLPAQKEYYVSYWVRFDQNFDFDGSRYSGGKLPGLGGAGGLCSGGQTCNGNNGFTSRYMWNENGRAILYLYHMDKKQKWGDGVQLRGADGKDKYFERGKWHNMIQRVKINDGYQSNGEIDVWMDNEKVLDMDDLRFVTNNRGIDQLYFSTFHGGNGSAWWPSDNVDAYFDDFIVSTNPADVGL